LVLGLFLGARLVIRVFRVDCSAMKTFKVYFKSGPSELIEADHIGPVAEGVIALQTANGDNIAFFTIAEIIGIVASTAIKE
jgi:hypothetical protein